MTSIVKEQLSLEEITVPGFHKIVKATHPGVGLKAIISIHDVRLGKAAMGGTRIYPYKTMEEALFDVTRLSRGMTHKSAIAQCGWGGAKSVIIADPKRDKTEELLHAFGEAVTRLEGLYICAEDSGCSPQDIAVIAEKTPYAVGLPHEKSSGNPSPFTAWGVFRGIQAVMHHLFGSDSVAGKTVAIQGVGSVGARLAELLFWHGAKIIVTDIHLDNAEGIAKQFGGKCVKPDEIFEQPCDVFAPCAMGGIIYSKNIDRLRCRAIAGAANNQLLSDADGQELHRLGILYAPDFLVNAGGLINVTEETYEKGYNPFIARNKIDEIYTQLKLIFKIASQKGISTQAAAMELVDYRLKYQSGRRASSIHMHHAEMSF